MWIFGIFIIVLYSPLVWVRTLEFFKKGYIFANAMIILTVGLTAAYCVGIISRHSGSSGPDFVALNKAKYWQMVGFAFFMFEGIGCLMPILKETAVPEQFGKLTVQALCFLCTIYIAFCLVCYYAWGASLDEPVVTEMLPADNILV